MADRRLDPTLLRAHIDALRHSHPQIANEEDAWLLTLESETQLHEFLTAIVDRIQDTDAKIKANGDRIAQLKARCDRFEQRSDTMRALARKLMQVAEIKKLELPEATLSIVKPRERVVVANDADVPAIYCYPPVVKPDLKKIKTALDAGERFNWASIQVGEPTLMIRPR